jgi:hypothetical protein
LRNLDEKIQKSTHFSVEIETNCQETPKISDLDKFLDLNRDFSDFLDVSRQNRDFSISIEKSRSSRLTFWNCRDFLGRWDWLFFGVEIEISIEITSRPIETPRLIFNTFPFKNLELYLKINQGKILKLLKLQDFRFHFFYGNP